MGHFQNIAHGKWRILQNDKCRIAASICDKFTKYPSKYMIWGVYIFYTPVEVSLVFNKGTKINEGR